MHPVASLSASLHDVPLTTWILIGFGLLACAGLYLVSPTPGGYKEPPTERLPRQDGHILPRKPAPRIWATAPASSRTVPIPVEPMPTVAMPPSVPQAPVSVPWLPSSDVQRGSLDARVRFTVASADMAPGLRGRVDVQPYDESPTTLIPQVRRRGQVDPLGGPLAALGPVDDSDLPLFAQARAGVRAAGAKTGTTGPTGIRPTSGGATP